MATASVCASSRAPSTTIAGKGPVPLKLINCSTPSTVCSTASGNTSIWRER